MNFANRGGLTLPEMVVQFWASPKFKFLHCSNTLYFELRKRVDFLKATLRKRNPSEAFLLQKQKPLLCKKSRCVNDICMKYWRLCNNDLYKAGCRFLGHRQIQVIIKKASFLGELKRIITLVNLCRTRRWLSKALFPMNPRPIFRRWHSRSTWKLILCLNLAGNRCQVLMRLPALFWGLALTENVDCMTGPFLEENLIVTGLQSFINMAIECLLLAFRALYLLLLFAPSIVIGTVAEEANIQIRSLWLGLLLRTVEHAGPAFIKWGQWAATRPDIFPPDICSELAKLHFRAPEHSFSETRDIVSKAFRLPIEEIFEEFSEKPVASGSIAQVHRAVLKQKLSPEGKPITVAVKVRHPHVSKIIQMDFTIIKYFAKASTLMPGLKHLQLDKSVHHFASFMTKQVDLTLEATHLIRFKHNFRKWKNIDFPEPIYPFIHPEVLVETFEEGHSIAKYVNKEPQSYIKSCLAQLGTSLVLKMLLVDNFFHGDLHPGNIFVRLDGELPQIILLDVGMIVELSQRNRLILSELFKAAALRDGKTVAKCMLEFSREQRCPDPEQFVRNVDEKFKRYLAVEGSAKNTGECMTDLFNDVRQHHVTIDGDICTVMVSTLIYEGWQRKLDPNMDMLDMFNKQLVRAAQVDSFSCFMMGAIAL